jgi:hypothetical protein
MRGKGRRTRINKSKHRKSVHYLNNKITKHLKKKRIFKTMKYNLPECAVKPLEIHQTPQYKRGRRNMELCRSKSKKAQKEIIFTLDNTEYLDL